MIDRKMAKETRSFFDALEKKRIIKAKEEVVARAIADRKAAEIARTLVKNNKIREANLKEGYEAYKKNKK